MKSKCFASRNKDIEYRLRRRSFARYSEGFGTTKTGSSKSSSVQSIHLPSGSLRIATTRGSRDAAHPQCHRWPDHGDDSEHPVSITQQARRRGKGRPRRGALTSKGDRAVRRASPDRNDRAKPRGEKEVVRAPSRPRRLRKRRARGGDAEREEESASGRLGAADETLPRRTREEVTRLLRILT